MFKIKAFSLAETITTIAITAIVFGGVSLSVGSMQVSSEILSAEDIFTAKIRSEKISSISGEINCSKINISYGNNFFEVFHGTEKNFYCKKKFFGNFYEDNGKIFLSFNKKIDDLVIQIFSNGSIGGEIYPEKNTDHQLIFDLNNDFSYKITAQNGDLIEELEIIFLNSDPEKITQEAKDFGGINPNKIIIREISGKNLKKEKITGNALSIFFTNSNPKSKLMIRNQEINNAFILLNTLNGESTVFNFFSANLFGRKKILNISEILN